MFCLKIMNFVIQESGIVDTTTSKSKLTKQPLSKDMRHHNIAHPLLRGKFKTSQYHNVRCLVYKLSLSELKVKTLSQSAQSSSTQQ